MDTPFFGGSYESFSSNLANDRCMNLYPEVVESKQGKAIGGFYSTPGLRQWLAIGAGPIRGLAVATGQNKLVVVSGNTVYTLDMNGVQVTLGTLSTTSGPVGILTNATQVFVCDGLNGWVYSGGLWAKTDLVTPAVACQQDGFGLVNQVGTNQVWQSNLNDFTVWDGLNFTSIDSEPSPVVGMVDLFRQVWFLKHASCEIWNNAGLNGFAFQRMQGAFLEQGCIAPASVCNAGDRILWLGQDARGQGVVYTTHGYQGARASNHGVEAAMLGYSMLSDAVAYVYQQMGHTFYVLNFPTGNATWVYDVHLGLWHQRGEFANGEYARHDGNCHASWQGMALVGSASQGVIYQYDMLYPTDDISPTPDANPKRWARRWRALKNAVFEPVRFGALQLDMQIQPPPGNPAFNPTLDQLSITGSPPQGVTGSPFSFQYTLAGKFPPFEVSVTSGTLPPGLSLSATGLLSGTPTATGTYTWTATVTDRLGVQASDPTTMVVKKGVVYAVGTGITPIYWPASSVDGLNWVGATTAPTTPYDNIAIGNDIYLASAVVAGPAGVARSTDGINWTSITVPFPCGGAACFGNGLFVFGTFPGGTDAAQIWTSTDGENWNKQVASIGKSVNCIRYLNGNFIAVCLMGEALTSSDGMTWNTVSLGGSNTQNDVAFGNGVYMVIGNNQASVSTDLVHWTQQTQTFGDATSVAFFSNTWVALANGIAYLSTNNGASWSAVPSLTPVNAGGIISAFGRIMIPRQAGGLYESTDLVNWTVVQSTLPTEHITFMSSGAI